MDKFQVKFMKLSIQHEISDSHRQRDMVAINTHMDLLLDLFGEEIVWDSLHNTDTNSQMHLLRKIIRNVKNITTTSNKESNEAINEQTTI